MRFIEILIRIFSLLIAGGVLFYAIYYFPEWGSVGIRYSKGGREVINIFLMFGWLIISLGCIWFAEYVSEWLVEIGEGGWNPTWLVKLVGWLFLLTPAIILLYCKVL